MRLSERVWQHYGFANFSHAALEGVVIAAQRQWQECVEVAEALVADGDSARADEWYADAAKHYAWGEFVSWEILDLETERSGKVNYSTIPLASRLLGKSLLTKMKAEQRKQARLAKLKAKETPNDDFEPPSEPT